MSCAFVLLMALCAPPVETGDTVETPDLFFVQAVAEWSDFSNAEAGFSVKLPGQPMTMTRVLDTNDGKLTVRTFVLRNDTTIYLVAASVYPEATDLTDTKKLLDTELDSFAQSAKVDVVEQGAMEGVQYPNQEARVKQTGGASEGAIRLHLIGRRLYFVAMLGRNQPLAPADAKQFFESFQIKP